jgi:hypothetical protein
MFLILINFKIIQIIFGQDLPKNYNVFTLKYYDIFQTIDFVKDLPNSIGLIQQVFRQ